MIKTALTGMLIATFSMLGAPPATAAGNLLHMSCDWTRSTDMKSYRTVPASGTTDFFYEPISDLTGTMRKDGIDETFVAGVRDKLIEGIVHYKVDGSPAEQRVEINRHSGAIMNLIKIGDAATVLEGKCRRISGPDFGQEGSAD